MTWVILVKQIFFLNKIEQVFFAQLFAHDIETKDEKYLFRYKLIFCLLSVTATLVTTLFFLYVYYFVDGDYIGKIGFNVSMGVQMLNHLATNSFLTQFYVALYMKFEALNEYFR